MTLESKKLREARAYLGLSQMEAAELLEVSLVTYQRWEQGKARPQPYHLRQIRLKFKLGFQASSVIASEPGNQSDLRPKRKDETASVVFPPLMPTFLLEDGSTTEREEFKVPLPMTLHLLSLAYMDHSPNSDKPGVIRQAIKEFDRMNTNNKSYQITRREAIGTLAALPMATLGLSLSGRTVQPTQYGMTLAHCAASLEACWELSKSSDASDLALAFKSVSKSLPILETIARNASQYQQEALHLAIQYALVKTILGWHCASSTATIQYAQDAVVLSKEADDIPFQLSAYSKLAWAYFYAKKYLLALATAQEAEALLQQHLQQLNVQPLPSCIQNGIYSTLAVIQAKNGKSSDVALGKATEVDPGDEVCAFMDFTQSMQLLEAGWAYCYQGNQIKTMETLKKRINPETLVPTIAQSEIGRLETINILTLSSLRAKDRDMGKTIHFWRAAIESAKALQSEWAFTEAVTNYQFMEIAYPGEARIAELRDLIVHWNDERTEGSNTR